MDDVSAVYARSPEKKELEQLSISGTSHSYNNVNECGQQLATPCFKFGSSGCPLTSAVYLERFQTIAFFMPENAATVCMQTSEIGPLFLPVDASAAMRCAPVNSGETFVHSRQEKETAFSLRLSPGDPGVVSGQSIHPQRDSFIEAKVEQMNFMSSEDADNNKNILSDCVPREAMKKYLALEKFLKLWKSFFENAISKPEWKKWQLLLMRAVNTPINCISSLSGAHLLDKIERLDKFLSGESVDLGGETVSINIAPEARHFCMDLLAKKIVSQGENQVSSHPEDAFPLAAAMVYLWQKYSDLGFLFMAHLFKKCPYVVPYYVPLQEGQNEEQQRTVEKRVQFLKGISGLSRLYFAIIQTRPKLKKAHPHGIGYGWKWMTHIMTLEPRPDITATVLLDFLEVCGHSMQERYGKQFKKLLVTLISDFLPKIKISGGSMGPVMRLEEFLKETMKKGFISLPKGVITDAFWESS